MLSGGLQEPRDVIALVVIALGSDPAQLEEVRADRRSSRPAVEETLRWAGPVGTATRQTTEPTELAGRELPEGAVIGAVLSSANRDPRRFTDPDRFDVHRKEGAHLAFAVGEPLLPRGVVRAAPRPGLARDPARPPAGPPAGPRAAADAARLGVPGARLDVGALGRRVSRADAAQGRGGRIVAAASVAATRRR